MQEGDCAARYGLILPQDGAGNRCWRGRIANKGRAIWSIIPGVRNKLMIGCDWPNVHSESTPGAVRTNDAPLN
jgi:hypothetical protein